MRIFHQAHNSQGNHSYNVFIYDNTNYPPHFHKNYEIIYVISGKAACSVNGKCRTLDKGDFAMCLSNEIHSVKTMDDSQIWVGVFSEDFIHEFKKKLGNKTGADFKFRCSDSVQRFLNENLIKERPENILMIKACLYALCSEYISKIPLTEADNRCGLLATDIATYIEENFKNPITLGNIAEHFGYDYCYLSKAFRKMFSIPFNDYLSAFRIDCALDMLTETALPITDIAFKSGFQSIRSFNNVFKKQTGMTPSEFRKSSN